MRSLLLTATALLTVAGATVLQSSTASAVVCADGVRRAGCAGARGAVVVRKPVVAPVVAPVVVAPVAACRWVWVNGVKVRRCV